MDLTSHFTFTGAEPAAASIFIRDNTLQIERSHNDTANLHVIADSQTWIEFLHKEISTLLSKFDLVSYVERCRFRCIMTSFQNRNEFT